MVFAPVQVVATTNQLVPATVTIAPATAGNLLVLSHAMRAGGSAGSASDNVSGTAGWTNHPDGIILNTDTELIAWKVAVGGETTIVGPIARNDRNRLVCAEFPLAGAIADAHAELAGTTNPVTAGSITPSRGPVLLVMAAAVAVSDALPAPLFTPDANTTEIDDGKAGTSFHPAHFLGFRYLEAPAGAYALTATCGQSGRAMASQILALLGTPPKGFPGEPGGGVW